MRCFFIPSRFFLWWFAENGYMILRRLLCLKRNASRRAWDFERWILTLSMGVTTPSLRALRSNIWVRRASLRSSNLSERVKRPSLNPLSVLIFRKRFPGPVCADAAADSKTRRRLNTRIFFMVSVFIFKII